MRWWGNTLHPDQRSQLSMSSHSTVGSRSCHWRVGWSRNIKQPLGCESVSVTSWAWPWTKPFFLIWTSISSFAKWKCWIRIWEGRLVSSHKPFNCTKHHVEKKYETMTGLNDKELCEWLVLLGQQVTEIQIELLEIKRDCIGWFSGVPTERTAFRYS